MPTDIPNESNVAAGLRHTGTLPSTITPTKESQNRSDGMAKGPEPVAGPYLVVPAADLADNGSRPLSAQSIPFQSAAIQIYDSNNNLVTAPVAGVSYQIQCMVNCEGSVACNAGLAMFYAGSDEAFDTAASTGQANAGINLIGVAQFTLRAGQRMSVKCPVAWTPKTGTETLLVQAYDLFSDPLTHPFDVRSDRHVGRRDVIADFTGTWRGTETLQASNGQPTTRPLTVVITQSGGNIHINANSGAGNGTIAGNVANATTNTTSAIPNTPLTAASLAEHWTLTLTDTNTLRVDHQYTIMTTINMPSLHGAGTPRSGSEPAHGTATLQRQ